LNDHQIRIGKFAIFGDPQANITAERFTVFAVQCLQETGTETSNDAIVIEGSARHGNNLTIVIFAFEFGLVF